MLYRHDDGRLCGDKEDKVYLPERFWSSTEDWAVVGTTSRDKDTGEHYPWFATSVEAVAFIQQEGWYGRVVECVAPSCLGRPVWDVTSPEKGYHPTLRDLSPCSMTGRVTDIVNCPCPESPHVSPMQFLGRTMPRVHPVS